METQSLSQRVASRVWSAPTPEIPVLGLWFIGMGVYCFPRQARSSSRAGEWRGLCSCGGGGEEPCSNA